MGAHTAPRDTDHARRGSLTGRVALTGVAALALLGGGAGTALASDQDGGQRGTGNVVCGAEGGDLQNDAVGTGLGGIGQGAGPVASGNTGQIGSCNSFLNDNLNDLSINVLSEQCGLEDGGLVNDDGETSDLCQNNVPLSGGGDDD